MRVSFALLLALWPAVAEDYDPTEVLIRLRDRFEPAIQSPKTCDAVIARRNSDNFSSMLRRTTTDRLRLDVLLAEGREMFSWAGAGKFDGREIDEMIPERAGAKTASAALPEIPPGRPFSMKLDADIDPAIAAGGDRFTARLETPIRDAAGRILAPR